MILVVGSTSPIKTQAFLDAFDRVEVKILPVKATSLVPEQPCGAQTFLGARNRCFSAKVEHPVIGAFYVAIENGIKANVDEMNEMVDFPVLHVVAPDGFEFMTTGPTMVIPLPIYEEWEQRSVGDPNLTWGDVYAEHMGCDPKDPHKHLTGTPRLQYLINTIRPVIPIILSHRC